jgi:hypothetical protein
VTAKRAILQRLHARSHRIASCDSIFINSALTAGMNAPRAGVVQGRGQVSFGAEMALWNMADSFKKAGAWRFTSA